MVLKPLEFSDALSDSPWFRQNLHEHEQALDETAKSIKQIADHCRKLISSMRKVCQSQKSFATLLTEFKLATVGNTQTDDERAMANSVKEFGLMLLRIEEHRARILADAETHYLDPLKELVENINTVLHESKRKYEKESQRFYSSLEKHLHLSTAKKTDFREADTQLGQQQQAFCQASLQYVSEVQSIQETLKFAFVETLTTFLTHWMTFYKIGNDANEKFRPQLMSVQQKVQNAKQSFEATQAEANMLKQKMLTSHMKTAVFPSGSSSDGSSSLSTGNIKQGYIYMQEKSKIPTKLSRDVLSRPWTKYYCVFSKETRIFTMIPVNSSAKTDMKGALEQSVSFKLKSCIRRASDSIDKRFCFDLVAEERPDVMTFQALSEEDRRQWIDTMDGKEPVYSPGAGPPSANSFDTMLDDTGFEFVRICLKAIEEKGLKEQGLYRNCGVTSKVQRLMQLALDKKKGALERLNLNDDSEWETKTISSAVKTFLRNLPEPLMTFELHNLFINAAKLDDGQQRVNHIHYYVYKLPESHRKMLEIIIRHLRVVADNCGDNLMTVGNLGVCFGPTLLRPQEETMAAIMDIKFCNVVVEVLISNCATIFSSPSTMNIGLPCPPKPAHNILVTNGSETADQSKVSPKPMRNNERNIDDALSTTTATARMVQTIMPNTPSTPSLDSSSPQSLVRQRQPPPPPKGAQLYEKVPFESKSSDDLTASSGGSSNIYPNLSVNQSSRFTTPRILDGAISSSRSGTGSDDMITPAANPVNTITRSKFSATYAPPYNPQACDNVHANLSSHAQSSSGLSNNGGTTRTAPNPPTFSTMQPLHTSRIPPQYSSLINPEVQYQPSRRVKTLYSCVAGHETELSFEPGQIITNVYESKEEGWLVGTLNGKTGLIPANYVEPLPGPQ
uniref:Rho GTPase-activating protein 26 n=1 Tax=Panagrolaimus sp. JU765 TaxID=591449 RepID=A0AC34RJC4_9BILA